MLINFKPGKFEGRLICAAWFATANSRAFESQDFVVRGWAYGINAAPPMFKSSEDLGSSFKVEILKNCL